MSDEIQIFHELEQGSPEWKKARAGLPTASKFQTIQAQGKTKGSPSVTRRKYAYTLVGERLTGEPEEGFSNGHTERGQEQEGEACDLYAMLKDVEPVKVGFVRRGRAGASPDRLVGDKGLLEVKCKLASLQIELLEGPKELPSEHVAQVQGQLWVTGRDWCDFISYCRGLPPFIVRVERDPIYIAEMVRQVHEFADEVDGLEKRIRALMGQ